MIAPDATYRGSVPPRTRRAAAALCLLAAATVSACSTQEEQPAASITKTPAATTPAAPSPPATPTPTPTPTPTQPTSTPTPRSQGPAVLRIPALQLERLTVVPYTGSPDDGPGTRIQNTGKAASPHGALGGLGPGEVGNYIVTGHRNSHGGPLHELPSLARGDTVEVTAGGTVFTYTITGTRSVSFRSKDSLRKQRAAVPGSPGIVPTRASITISTCATQEDHAAGNFWADAFDNPEHRIDKIGVLTSTRPD